ncbi:LytTR family transcriptional regulator DNA-binding domain-containing protein [Gottfriedia luciferensis]|uniref:LytTR family transcriptional regulator DNA-binding domain-containing protein n=1 Tax=Gottfriedia luciferensis TaxID=178774 RepID=UPI0038B22DD3
MLSSKDIFYFESVDKKNFIYTDKEVFETALRLYEVEEIQGDSELKIAYHNEQFCTLMTGSSKFNLQYFY